MSRSRAEELECMALNDWALRQAVTIKELRLLFHIPNGGLRPFKVENGRRYSVEAQKLVRMGVRKGVHDYLLPCPRNFQGKLRAGLWIEMKEKGKALTAEQKWWEAEMVEQGYAAATCRTWIGAREVILAYLGVLDQMPRLAMARWPQ